MPAPTAIPATTQGQTLPTTARTDSTPFSTRPVNPRRSDRGRTPPFIDSYTHASTCRSSFIRPRTNPDTMAMVSPVVRYSAAIFQPNRPTRSTRATSFTIGAEMRKESVTPRGIPTSTKPRKSGTAEQEQNGVTTPSSAASTLPTDSRFPRRMSRVRSALKKDWTIPTPKTIRASRRRTLGASYRKNATLCPRRDSRARPRTRYVRSSETGDRTAYAAAQPASASARRATVFPLEPYGSATRGCTGAAAGFAQHAAATAGVSITGRLIGHHRRGDGDGQDPSSFESCGRLSTPLIALR